MALPQDSGVGATPSPHNIQAEQSLLAAILVNNVAFERVSDILEADHFYQPAHQRIYAAIAATIGDGRIADPVSIRNYFEADPNLSELQAGGEQYLGMLAQSVVTIVGAPDYAYAIRDCWLRRQIIEIASASIADAGEFDIERDAEQIIDQIESKLVDLGQGRSKGSALLDTRVAGQEALYQIQDAMNGKPKLRVPTGMADLDDALYGGFEPGLLYLLGARPSMGKSALMGSCALGGAAAHVADDKDLGDRLRYGCAIFSQEMKTRAILLRMAAHQTGIALNQIVAGRLDNFQFAAVQQAITQIGRLPIFVDDSPRLSTGTIRIRLMRLMRKYPDLKVAYVDHLHKMKQPGKMERRIEIEQITGDLAETAKDLGIAIVLLSQLSRASEQREDKCRNCPICANPVRSSRTPTS